MEDRGILEIAKKIAERLNIQIKNEQQILKNMQPAKNPITTILYNKDYTLWIDKYYIAYSDSTKPTIIYAYISTEHIRDELPFIKRQLTNTCDRNEVSRLKNIKNQMSRALKVMALTKQGFYIDESIDYFPTDMRRRR